MWDFSSLEADNMLVSFLLVSLITPISRVVYRLFVSFWPNLLHRFLLLFMLKREVSTVNGECTSMRMIDNEELMDIVLAYVAHLVSMTRQQQQEEGREKASIVAPSERGSGDNSYHRFLASKLSRIPIARYRLMRGARAAVKKSDASSALSPAGSGGTTMGIGQFLADYRIVTVPANEVSLEVEPQLFVKHTDPSISEDNGNVMDANGYLFEDLQAKETRAGGFLANILRGPFRAEGKEGERDGEKERSDDDDESEMASKARMEAQAKTIKMVTLMCYELVGVSRASALAALRTHTHLGIDAETRPTGEQVLFEASETAAEQLRLRPKSRIDEFIRRAQAWHKEQIDLSQLEGTTYFLYPATSEIEAGLKTRVLEKADEYSEFNSDKVPEIPGGGRLMEVRRYPFPKHGSKTFASLFFSDKAKVMATIADFQSQQGKFGIPGARQDMTLLLHGAPGTGKTSLVKAIAHAMRRHVMAIPLSAIQTNAALHDWMNEATLVCKGERTLDSGRDSEYDEAGIELVKMISLKPCEVIYLLEDIDAVALEGISGSVKEMKRENDPPGSAESSENSGEETSDADSEDKVKRQEEDEEKEATSAEDVEENTEEETTSAEDSDGSAEEESDDMGSDNDGSICSERINEALASLVDEYSRDKLTVAGLLRVFSSAAIPPGRVIIMTTNHPEKLDARLLRPGVVTLRINMEDLSEDLATDMVHHYFEGDVEPTQAEQLRASLRKHHYQEPGKPPSMNPSQLEQLCAGCESVEELLEILRDNSGLSSINNTW